MVDVTVPESPTDEQAKFIETKLFALDNEISKRNLNATIFSTRDAVDSYIRLRLGNMGIQPNYELAISGDNSNETLSNESYAKQKEILEKSKSFVEKCRFCGVNEIIAMGFMPQSFDQNDDTYKVLEDLGIQYDAGFQAGLLFAPGHENDVWPYKLEGYELYAVPVSTTTLLDKKLVLQDSYFEKHGLSATQWYNTLAEKFDEIQGKDEPLIIILTPSVSGSGDYLDALKRFMDYAISKKADFVTTIQLVNMAKAGRSDISKLTTKPSAGCATCGTGNTNTDTTIKVSLINSTEVEDLTR
jgi:hypothetical protein